MPLSDHETPFTLRGIEVKSETADAVLVASPLAQELWIPRSEIFQVNLSTQRFGSSIVMSMFIARQEGLV